MNQLEILQKHKENLLAAGSFEEYRIAHIAYIDMLINYLKLDLAQDEVVLRWTAVLVSGDEVKT